MWRISLIPDGGNNVIKSVINNDFTSEVEIPSFFANSIYECENIGQLIMFYHANMGYPVTEANNLNNNPMEEKGKPQTFGIQMGTVGGMASK
jgi:hypothetical protein